MLPETHLRYTGKKKKKRKRKDNSVPSGRNLEQYADIKSMF